ncbi:MAG: hypothetical protein JJE49_08415 [Peptostreptococcaceae bacterium]|nr:hypothetical protein [Peptostreptococcaceae bacterium]
MAEGSLNYLKNGRWQQEKIIVVAEHVEFKPESKDTSVEIAEDEQELAL